MYGTTYQITEATMEDTESLAKVNAAQANFQSTEKERETIAPLLKRTGKNIHKCDKDGYIGEDFNWRNVHEEE